MSEYIYIPSPWQQRFHGLTKAGVHEALGAGAAGPGKTTTLLHDTDDQILAEHERCANRQHRHHQEWGASTGWCLHLRRTRLQLESTISQARRSFVAMDPGVQWNEQKSTFTFTSGYKYQFGHCKDPNDWENYLSFEFCVAKDTPVLMADGTWRPIQNIKAGDSVATLEGARVVRATWDSGVKPCVSVTTSFQGEIVGTQIHPTTHPVLLLSTDESQKSSSVSNRRNERRDPSSELYWQDYESLLGERPESSVKRVSEVVLRNGGVEYRGSLLESSQLPTYCVPVALFEPLLDSAGGYSSWPIESHWRQGSCGESTCSHLKRVRLRSAQCDGLLPTDGERQEVPDRAVGICSCGRACAPTGSETATSFQENCSACSRPHGEQLPQVEDHDLGNARQPSDVATHAPTNFAHDDRGDTPKRIGPIRGDYPHFYTGERRRLTEGYRRGEAEISFAGFFQTFDLTVDGANHYITSTGLVNAQTAIMFDELTAFNEEQYDQICTRLRSTDPVLSLMLKIRSMSNPLMRRESADQFIIHDPHWVRRRFVDKAPQGNVLFKRKLIRSDGTIDWHKWIYLPAKLSDNPNKSFVKQYEAQLLKQKPHIRRALLDGDWYVTEGSFFAEYWNKNLHVCKPFTCSPDWRFFRSMDWGFKATGVIYWFAMDEEETLYVIKELKFKGKLDVEVAAMVQVIETNLGLWDERRNESRIEGVADTQLWEMRGQTGKNMGDMFREKGVHWRRADKKSRQANAAHIIKRLTDHDDGTKVPGVVIFDTCSYLIQTLPAIQTSLTNSEEPMSGGDDHGYDAFAYGVAFASRGRAGIPETREERDEWEEEDDRNGSGRRGRHGYGQELC